MKIARGLNGEEHGGLRLERLAHNIVALHIGACGHAYTRPGAGTALEEPVVLETQQRLGDGEKTHPQFGRDFAPRGLTPALRRTTSLGHGSRDLEAD